MRSSLRSRTASRRPSISSSVATASGVCVPPSLRLEATSTLTFFPQVVRAHAVPSHRISYSGKLGYRTIFPISLLDHIPNLPRVTRFWHGPDTSLFTTPIGDGLFEVSGRGPEPKELGEAVSWGQAAGKEGKEAMKKHFVVRPFPRRNSLSPSHWQLFVCYTGVPPYSPSHH